MKCDIKEVVRWQDQNVISEFNVNDMIEQTEQDLEKETDPEEIKELVDDVIRYKEARADYKNNHETPINLSDCILPQLTLVRFTNRTTRSLHYIDGADFRNTFILLGDTAQAPGHVTIISQVSMKIYTMIHSEELEVVPPQEC